MDRNIKALIVERNKPSRCEEIIGSMDALCNIISGPAESAQISDRVYYFFNRELNRNDNNLTDICRHISGEAILGTFVISAFDSPAQELISMTGEEILQATIVLDAPEALPKETSSIITALRLDKKIKAEVNRLNAGDDYVLKEKIRNM